MDEPLRILGIDPGSRITGFGLVEVSGLVARPVSYGGIRADGDHVDRLKQIFRALTELLAEHRPHEIAIERVFIHRNADSALKLGQARAAALCATFETETPIYEYAARHIKKALVGNGSADKEQVQYMVKLILGLTDDVEPDAADALAAAVCHAHQRDTRALIDRVVAAR